MQGEVWGRMREKMRTKGNVLVIGNSGVGKSTLINAVLGEEVAKTGWGTSGTTKELEIYESEAIPFRIIDTVGFEPSFFKKRQAVQAVKKWSKNSAKEGHEDSQINVIWFCIDGTSRKLFPDTIKSLSGATSVWESVPIIVVITKSYSVPEREENIEMVNNAFAKQKKHSKNLRKVLPVVASAYVLNESACAPPEGITELIEATNELLPEGIKAAEKDISKFKLNRKRVMAQSVIGLATTSGVVVGAVPIPFADGAILAPIEVMQINAIAKIYELNKREDSKKLLNTIVEVGTVGTAAKATISALKAIPGINLAASVINAVVAGCFVAAIGEGTAYAFEQIYLGNKKTEDIDWITKVIESKLSADFLSKVKKIMMNTSKTASTKEIAKMIMELFGPK